MPPVSDLIGLHTYTLDQLKELRERINSEISRRQICPKCGFMFEVHSTNDSCPVQEFEH